MAKNKKLLKYIVIGIFFFCISSLLIVFVGEKYSFGINISESLGYNFFVYNKHYKGKLQKGQIIYFKFPKNTFYYKKDTNFGKIIVCKEGDLLTTKGLKYYCNGKYLATALTRDSKGRLVKNFNFNGIIPAGKFFVMGTHPRSYDSRYWGFVDRKDIVGVAICAM